MRSITTHRRTGAMLNYNPTPQEEEDLALETAQLIQQALRADLDHHLASSRISTLRCDKKGPSQGGLRSVLKSILIALLLCCPYNPAFAGASATVEATFETAPAAVIFIDGEPYLYFDGTLTLIENSFEAPAEEPEPQE